MSRYCSQADGRIKLINKIKERFEYFKSFDDFYFLMTRFHRAISPIHTISDVITTNWDDFFEQVCEFDPFVYDEDLAFWDSSRRRVMKIHGSITNFGSIVATEDDYRRSFKRLNNGPLGAHLKSLISRKTLVYTGYSLSDDNYIRILRNISKMMGSNMRQSYFLSPFIDHKKLASLPVKLVPIETDGAFFFEQVREHLQEKIGIIKDISFDNCRDFLRIAIEAHDATADYFSKSKHPLLAFVLSYQDGLIHALQRIRRKRKAGEYHSSDWVRQLVHGYEHKFETYQKKDDYWNAMYARGYQNGLLYLLVCDNEADPPNPPLFHAPFERDFLSPAAVARVRRKDIPAVLLKQFEKIPVVNKQTGETLIPDHTPYL